MSRAHVLITIAAWSMALALVGLHVSLAPSLPSHVNIRWSPRATDVERTLAERELTLTEGRPQDERTWTYALRDRSPQNITRIIRHPLVEDTHHLDRDRFTLEFDTSHRAPWVQFVARQPIFRRFAYQLDWLLTIARALAVIGLIGLWPVARRSTIAWVGAARVAALAPENRLVSMLALVMLASLVLRIVLVFSGGQFYWGDEDRYRQAGMMARELSAGAVVDALSRLGRGDHPLFKVIGLPPAAVEMVVGQRPWIPGVYFAAFSVLNVGLLGLIASRMGAAREQAILAGGLLALSSTFFYYARHLLPYDPAMTLGLVALYFGAERAGRARSSLLCGVFAGCAFFTYTGYWTLGGAALVVHVANSEHTWMAFRRAVLGSLGLTAVIGLMVVMSTLMRQNLIQCLLQFSKEIHQGSFDEGWRLPWEYFWHAEHLLVVAWLLAVAWCLARAPWEPPSRNAWSGLVALAFVYGSLVVLSVAVHKFVVYGRLARQMVPFFCLVTAAAFCSMRARLSPLARVLVTRGVAIILIVQAAFNFMPPLRQTFPSEFLRERPGDASVPTGATVIALNAKHLYPGPEPVTLPARYSIVRQAPHPLQFLPYQYEGYSPTERNVLRSTDIAMRLIVVPPQ